MSLKEKTQSLFANAFGYPATHTIQAPGRHYPCSCRPHLHS